MEVVKVGDVFEFTIIQLDKDRRRIGLSLKSDAASRIGQGGGMGRGVKPAAREAGTATGDGKKRVVVVKKSASGAPAGNRDNRSGNGGRGNYNSGSDDGMSYNPFAAFFNK
jgi:uncharacterized protein